MCKRKPNPEPSLDGGLVYPPHTPLPTPLDTVSMGMPQRWRAKSLVIAMTWPARFCSISSPTLLSFCLFLLFLPCDGGSVLADRVLLVRGLPPACRPAEPDDRQGVGATPHTGRQLIYHPRFFSNM
jgi:hypothetical protein